MDLSWPHLKDPDVFGHVPISINDGIDSELFPTSMTSINAVLELVNKAGPSGYLVKQDWSDAYKHINKAVGA